MAIGEQVVKSGDIVLDCGANVGVYTRVALDRGARTVVAIEPAPENIESLRRNFKEEIAAGRVIVYPKGVWDKDEMLILRARSAEHRRRQLRHPKDKNAAEHSGAAHDHRQAGGRAETGARGLHQDGYRRRRDQRPDRRASDDCQSTIRRLSLASYHIPTDAQRIPEIVRHAWPDVKMEVGPCAETPDGHVRPDVLYFR